MRTGLFVLLTLTLAVPAARAQMAEKPDPGATAPARRQAAPAAQTPAPKPAPSRASRAAAAARASLTVFVTDREGRALEGVAVHVSGPVERDAVTDAEGGVLLRNMVPGAYRIHLEAKDFVPLEQDVTIGTRGAKSNAALTPAPPPPPAPPAPEPKPEPAAAEPPPSGPPTSLSIPDFFEKNYIGSAPSKRSEVGCTGTSMATLLQLRDPLAEHEHADADEMLYVIAGEGTERLGDKDVPLTAGVLTVLPRGTPHSLNRRGSRPLVLLSILTGPPCSSLQGK
jgi:mannose-6-phosphate isomerase-like protein (cupin superfamily)